MKTEVCAYVCKRDDKAFLSLNLKKLCISNKNNFSDMQQSDQNSNIFMRMNTWVSFCNLNIDKPFIDYNDYKVLENKNKGIPNHKLLNFFLFLG